MNTAETIESQVLPVNAENMIHFPLGLLGFERIKRYVLLSNPEEAPFMWLQMLDNDGQGFLVMPPETVIDGYQPDLSQEDVDFVGLRRPEDALLVNIVTLRPGGRSTVNLKGPIVINRHTMVGKQVIPNNAADFSLQFPLPDNR